MFDWVRRLWRGLKYMFDYTTLKTVIGQDITFSQTMIEAIDQWNNMLNGRAPWITDPVKSLCIEQGICREFADAVTVEMETGISNSEKLDKIYKKCLVDLNENLQDGLGLGSMVIRPLGADKAEFVTADKFIPIAFDDEGNPVDIAFITVKRVGEYEHYIKFERHYFINGNLTIENKCYRSLDRNYIGSECELSSVAEWAGVNPGPVTFPGMDKMDFGYYRNPVKNRVDGSDCGVSIFESAVELIEKTDIQAARLDWEYESGERAIHVDERALKKKKKVMGMARLNDRLYRGLNLEEGKDKELLREYSPEMRDGSYINGLERYYRSIEFAVGLAYGDLSDVQVVDKTATEVKASKIRKYNRVTAIQGKLRDCLEDFARGLAFYNGMYRSNYEFTCNFNDSILTDEETERNQDRQDVAMGAMPLWEYRAKWYNEDENTAREAVETPAEVMEE